MNRLAQLFTTAALAFACQGLPAAEFYVATTGKDVNPGTEAGNRLQRFRPR